MKTQLLMMACALTVATSAPAGRYEQLTARFASGEKMTPVAATFFGGRGAEEFVDAGQLPDGVIVAFGNSSGPDFPATPKPVVLGLGKHRGLKAVPTNGKGEKIFAQENPDLAGMLVFYGLIQTPNALYKPPTDGRRFGGNFVAVMTPEMNDLLFSTHLPASSCLTCRLPGSKT